jgi:von Willebrand factor type A domain
MSFDRSGSRALGRISSFSRLSEKISSIEADQRKGVDIAIVFDTTGSMSDKIDALIAIMVDFVRELSQLNLAWRLTCVPFGDLTVGDRIISDLRWVTRRADAEAMLRQMPRFSGGGNEGESSLEAVVAAMQREWQPRNVRCLVLLTDEPALQDTLRPSAVIKGLQDREIATFVLSPPIGYFKQMAANTSGTWYDIFSPRRPDELLTLLRQVARNLARTVEAVHRLAGGSVSRYRLLAASNKEHEGP